MEIEWQAVSLTCHHRCCQLCRLKDLVQDVIKEIGSASFSKQSVFVKAYEQKLNWEKWFLMLTADFNHFRVLLSQANMQLSGLLSEGLPMTPSPRY